MTFRRSTFNAIGTKWDIQVHDQMPDAQWHQVLEAVNERMRTFDTAYSRFRADSLVTQLSQAAGTYELPPDGFDLLALYEKLYKLTEGRMTPLIGRTMENAGYDAAYSFREGPLTAPPRWEDVLSYDTQTVTVKRPVLLDFGAAGKGYLVDIVAGILETAGFSEYTINAGGDIRHRSAGGRELNVGLENPRDVTEAIGIARLGNRSLCASSGSKRTWGQYHHIIDPDSLRSVADVLATWVIAQDTMTADGLATALFFTAPEVLQQAYDFTYGLLRDDMRMHYARDFPVTLFEVETS